MNLTKIAKMVSQMEIGEREVDITQIREILKCFLIIEASLMSHDRSKKSRDFLKSMDSFYKRHAKKIAIMSQHLRIAP